MKRVKIILVAVDILTAIGTAVATRPCQACTYSQQFYSTGVGYVPAGEFGYDYYCIQNGGICTYYRPYPIALPNYYVPCRSGEYTPVP
jgi:hypothetical protein